MKTFRDELQFCFHCDEPLDEDGDSGMILNAPSHMECAVRSIVGGINHLRRVCKCYGGIDPADPPEMTKREAAREAVVFWYLREREAKKNPAD